MYSRNEDDDAAEQATTRTGFGVSGKLWNGVLVMYDRATESLWTQIDGRAIDGERRGELLQHMPSSYTTWGAWVAKHPDTLVLDKPEGIRGFEHSRYDDYLADPEALFLPELAEGLGQVGPKDVVFGARVGEAQTAVTESLLAEVGLLNGLVGDVPVVWIRDAATGAVRAFDRRLQGRVLVLGPGSAPGSLRDRPGGATVQTAQLAELRVDRAFWYAWKRSHPETLLVRR